METASSYAQEQFQYFSRVKYRRAVDPVVRAYAEPKIDHVRKTIPLSRQSRILDLACGNGVFTYHLSRLSDFTVALDLSPYLLGQNPFGRLVCSDANILPFADDSFDVVFEANLLHHVPSRESVIEQMKRVSRRHLVFLEPNRLNPLMFLFSLAVPEERGVRKSSARLLQDLLATCGLHCLSAVTTGMISQNNTPAFLVPYLKRFDRHIWWGEYTIVIAEK